MRHRFGDGYKFTMPWRFWRASIILNCKDFRIFWHLPRAECPAKVTPQWKTPETHANSSLRHLKTKVGLQNQNTAFLIGKEKLNILHNLFCFSVSPFCVERIYNMGNGTYWASPPPANPWHETSTYTKRAVLCYWSKIVWYLLLLSFLGSLSGSIPTPFLLCISTATDLYGSWIVQGC